MTSMRLLGPLAIFALAVGIAGCQSDKNDRRTDSPFAGEPSQPEWDVSEVDQETDHVHRKNCLLMARATLCEVDNKPGEAARLYEAVLQAEPDHVEALHRLAVLRTQQGELAAADQCFQEALKLAGDNPQLHNDYGYFCHLQHKTDAALRHLRRAVALDPNLRAAHNNLGLVYAQVGRYGQAQTHFLSAGCTPAESHSNVAFSRLVAQDFAGAAASYKQALQDDPNLASARRGLAALHHIYEGNGVAQASGDAVAPRGANRAEQASYLQPRIATTGDAEPARRYQRDVANAAAGFVPSSESCRGNSEY